MKLASWVAGFLMILAGTAEAASVRVSIPRYSQNPNAPARYILVFRSAGGLEPEKIWAFTKLNKSMNFTDKYNIKPDTVYCYSTQAQGRNGEFSLRSNTNCIKTPAQ